MTAPRNLNIPVKGVYFDQIVSGLKTEEFRLCTDFWTKRLVGREYDNVVLTRGYPAKGDTSKRLVLPWKGFSRRVIQHEFFGLEPVEVFAIVVTG